MPITQLEVHPIGGALGAEVRGVDLGQDLDDATVAEIRRALLDHCVIFFRDQRFDAEQHKALARRFGEIFVHPNYCRHRRPIPRSSMIRREPGDTKIVGEDWHTDTTMMAEPPMGAILYAIETPPYGGDTLFANQYLAYETLSDGMKRLLAGAARRPQRPHGGGPAAAHERAPLDQGARGRRLARDDQRAPGRAHASGDRAQVPLREPLLHGGLRGHDRGGEPAAARLPARARPPPGVHLPLPLDGRRRRLLGQPLREAPGHQGLGPFRRSCAACRSPATGPGDGTRRTRHGRHAVRST